jgi:RNA ligase (TIGR02306 family)
VKFIWRIIRRKSYAITDVPEFKKYTDIENWRNYPDVFTEEDEVIITEKIHGTNFRAGWVNGTFYVGSHNVNRREKEDDIYWRTAQQYDLAGKLGEDQIIFGEIYGFKVQKMEYGRGDTGALFFDLMVDGHYLDFEEFKVFCEEKNLGSVPCLYEGRYGCSEVIKAGNGKSTLADHIREGCVIKSKREMIHPKIGRKILKYVNDDYLLGNYDNYDH